MRVVGKVFRYARNVLELCGFAPLRETIVNRYMRWCSREDAKMQRNLKSKMTLQVHDELVFDAHKDEVEIIKPIIYDKMIHAIKTNVPIEAEMGVGKNWLDAH